MTHVKGLVMVVLVLATIGLYTTQTSAASHGCCSEFTRGIIPLCLIKNYTEQSYTEVCPIDAIIFHTKNGKMCANPALDWVKNHIRRLSKVNHCRKTFHKSPHRI